MAGPLPSIRFIEGRSKNPLVPGVCVVDNRYKFYFNKVMSDGETRPVSLFYQCGMKKSSKCSASFVLTKNEDRWWPQNLPGDEVHNHASDRAAILADVMKKEMFNKVAKRPETKSDDAYRDVITEYEDRFGNEEQVWDEAIASLTSKELLGRHMRRIRNKEHGPLPKNRDDFDPEAVVKEAVGGHKVIILDSNKDLDKEFYKKLDDFKRKKTVSGDNCEDIVENTNSEDSFEAVNNDKTINGLVDYSDSSTESSSNESTPETLKPKRIIVYSTKHLLKLFNQRKSSGDGTFKISPALWKQLYVVMIKFGGSWIPVSYALLPDKSQDSYFTMFYMLRKRISSMKLSFNIESMRSDFEVGEMKAAAEAWEVVVKGCYFHFTQSGWRFVQRNNMASAYLADNDQEFKLFIKCMLSLPHVPVEDVEDTLEILKAKEWEFGESPEKHEFKDKFLTHIYEYWVNGVYPPQVWNCFTRKVDLTNNNNESHNNYLANAVKESHPSPATLTVALVKELTMAETKYRKVKSGAKRILKPRYQELNLRRNNLRKLYSQMDRIDYLSQMGNIVMHIQLNQGQMSEVRQAREQNNIENDGANDDEFIGDVAGSNDINEATISTGSNKTISSDEGNHAFANRVIGRTVKNGKEASNYEKPEYKGKKCLVCNGKFNVKSKYHVCKLCDRLVHVNNNKKCYKMDKYLKDSNYICFNCKDDTEERENVNQEISNDVGSNLDLSISDEDIDRETTSEDDLDLGTSTSEDDEDHHDELYESKESQKSVNWQDLTIGGTACEGLIFRNIQASTYNCDICDETFKIVGDLRKHKDDMHYSPCPICEKTFYRSAEKRTHIEQYHIPSVEDTNVSDLEDHPDELYESKEESQKSVNWQDLTIGGIACEGLVFENIQVNAHNCDICDKTFGTFDDLRNHKDDMHKNKSVEDSFVSQQMFNKNIQRQSTLIRGKVVVQFIGDVSHSIKDKKKRRKGSK